MTTKMEKKPAVVLDKAKEEMPPAEPKEAKPPAEPTQCVCTDVVRRWDTDGLIEMGKYRCSACGKWYGA